MVKAAAPGGRAASHGLDIEYTCTNARGRPALKIDGAVALSFAIVAAEQAGVPADVALGYTEEIKVLSNWDHEP